jgi:hypothetical protein
MGVFWSQQRGPVALFESGPPRSPRSVLQGHISFLKTAIDENGRQWVHVITPANSHQVGFFD